MRRSGPKSASQTPSPQKDRIKGSSKNPKGSAASKSSASKINLSDSVIKTLEKKRDDYNAKHPSNKVSLPSLKAVFRRGAGAFSNSYRPTISGGRPNSRSAWAFARVNKFLLKKGGTKVKAAFVQDDDLMERGAILDSVDPYGEVNSLIEEGVVDLKFYETTPEHAKEYGIQANKPLFVQNLIVLEKERLKGIGKKVLHHLENYANENGNDIIFGYLGDKASFSRDSRQSFYSDIDLIKNWLHNNGYAINNDTNEFHKVVKKNIRYDSKSISKYHLGGDMSKHLAPNGKPSNLTHEQWHLVRTPEFKAWFGDWENDPENASKVVDENGEPLVVYHGTILANNFFTKFNIVNSNGELSAHFGTLEQAKNRINQILYVQEIDATKNKRIGNRIIKSFFLNIKKPIELLDTRDWGAYTLFENVYRNTKLEPRNESIELQIKYLLKNGYDGVKYDNLYEDDGFSYIIFIENSVKLADGTNTTFDANNPDIRFEEGGLIAPNGNKSNLTPEQYKLVRTPEFKAWFGDWENDPKNASKVVDENGEPLVVYRGYSKSMDSNVFGYEKQMLIQPLRKKNEFGFYFTDNKLDALEYAKDLSQGKDYLVKSYFLNIRNLLHLKGSSYSSELEYTTLKKLLNQIGITAKWYRNNIIAKRLQLTNEKDFDQWYKRISKYDRLQEQKKDGYFKGNQNKRFYPTEEDIQDEIKKNINLYIDRQIDERILNEGKQTWEFFTDFGVHPYSQSKEFKYIIKDVKKYDGVWYFNKAHKKNYYKEYVAFESNQIKLADGSNTTFDANNPDIRFEDGGLLNALDVSMTNLKKNGIVLKDKNETITLIAYNTGNQERKPSLYNKSLIYKSVEPLQSKNEIIQNLDFQDFEIFDEKKIQDYKNSHLIIMNQNEVVYDSNVYAKGGDLGQEITCVNCGWHWNTKQSDEFDKYLCHNCGFDNRTFYDSEPIGYKNGGEMEKEIALPDTYANYDTLKPILEKQGYSIQKMEKMEKNYNKGGSLSEKTIFLKTQREARKLQGYYNDGGKVGITNCQVLDRNGERKIDLDSIEKMTDCLNEQPQTKFMHFDYDKNDYEPERKKLHRKIIYDFKKDLICVESDEPIAILMGGSPASGKSTFLKKYAPYLLKEEIFKIDADEIRSKLPEYKGFNATQTHLETKDIVNTLLSDRNIGIPCRFDLIYDGTMNNTKSYLPLINILKKDGYKVFIVYIDKVPKDVIVKRALERYKKSGRFVPLEVIDDFFEKGTAALEQLKNSVDGYMIIDGSSTDYKIIEKGGKKLPQDRNYSKIGEPIKITTQDVVREFKKGGQIDPDDNSIKDAITHKSGSAGGLLVGNRHSEGGIKAVNKSTNQMLEMEGGEIVITRDAVSDEQKREFEGEMLTNREILSRINVSGGGVSFANGGDVPSSCSCSGKKYNYGGSLKTDYEIIDSINKPTTKEIAMNYYAEGGMVTVDNPIGNGEISIPTLNYFVKKAYVLQQNGVKYIPKYDELYQSVIYYRNGDKRSKKMSTFDGYKFFINQKFAVPFEKLSDSVKKILIGK